MSRSSEPGAMPPIVPGGGADEPPETGSASVNGESRQVTRAAGVVGGATLLSRILGYVRDMVMASVFGAGFASDAFIAAFRIPNLLRRLFGEGSLSVAFVPVFTDYLTHSGKEEAFRLARCALKMLLVVLIAVALVGMLAAPWIVRMVAYGFTDEPGKLALTITLTRIMFPYIIFIGLVALCMGILNVLGHFAAPALAPVFLNVGMIGAMAVMAWVSPSPVTRVIGLSAGVLIGGGMQLLLQVPVLIGKGVRFWKSSGLWHPGLKRVAWLMGPTVFGAAVYQINIVVGTLLASLLAQGSVSYLYYADRLVQFPLGIFAIATATAVLPSLSRQAAAGQVEGLKATFVHAMGLVCFMTIPSMVGLVVLRQPIVALLFQRGAFDAAMTRLTADALLYYGVGLWAFAAVRIVLNTFYALQDTRTPVVTAAISIAANMVLGVILMRFMGHAGLALATSLASMINLALLVTALRRRLGALGWRKLARSVAKSSACAVLMGIVVYQILAVLPWDRFPHLIGQLIMVLLCIGGGALTYGFAAMLFKVSEFKDLAALLGKKTGLS